MSVEIIFKNGSSIKTIDTIYENCRSKPKDFMWKDTTELENYLIENNIIQKESDKY